MTNPATALHHYAGLNSAFSHPVPPIAPTDENRYASKTTHRVLESCGDFFVEHPDRARILLREPLANDTLRLHGKQRAPAFITAVMPLLDSEARELMSRRPDAIELVATALSGALITLYLDWADGYLDVTKQRLAAFAAQVAAALAVITDTTGTT